MRSRCYIHEPVTDWSGVIEFYEEQSGKNLVLSDLAKLLIYLEDQGYRDAGLQADTTMWSLKLSQSPETYSTNARERPEPYLVISAGDYIRLMTKPLPEEGSFVLVYEDGSSEPWMKEVAGENLNEEVEWFLTKRARWFKRPSVKSGKPHQTLCGPDCRAIQYPKRSGARVSIEIGVWGDVWLYKERSLPARPNARVSGVGRELRIHELTAPADVEYDAERPNLIREIRSREIAKTWSDRMGFFQFPLEVGEYSIFSVEDQLLYPYGSERAGKLASFPVYADVTGLVFLIQFDQVRVRDA